ncbi:uncharacterized protein [Brachyistius frenatus]|uniref:uncharacterized protein n=1 Tax=Brachyistius frenatus TaxID=100188 RepID=UPI0037E76BAF
MTINPISFINFCLLPLTASSAVTSGQNLINVTGSEVPGRKFTQNLLAPGEMTSSEVKGRDTTPSTVFDVTPPEEQPTARTNSFLLVTLTAETPTDSTLSPFTSSAGIKSTTLVLTRRTSEPTEPMTEASMLSSSETPTSQFSTDGTTRPATRPARSTHLTSTSPGEDGSTGPGTNVTQSTGQYRTSVSTTSIITRATTRQTTADKKSRKKTAHSKAVAGVICGTLILMMVSFLCIYIKKRKLQKQNITTTDWAGPSPFLESGTDSGQVSLRSSNRISLSSFLPQRLSRRLSLLPETDEELDDITPEGTFGHKNPESPTGGGKINGSTAAGPGMKSTGDAAEAENSATSSQTTDPPSTNHNTEDLRQVQSGNPSDPSGPVEESPAKKNEGIEQH